MHDRVPPFDNNRRRYFRAGAVTMGILSIAYPAAFLAVSDGRAISYVMLFSIEFLYLVQTLASIWNERRARRAVLSFDGAQVTVNLVGQPGFHNIGPTLDEAFRPEEVTGFDVVERWLPWGDYYRVEGERDGVPFEYAIYRSAIAEERREEFCRLVKGWVERP